MVQKQKRKKSLKGQDATNKRKVLGLRYKGLYQLTPLQRMAILLAQKKSATLRRGRKRIKAKPAKQRR
jgi:hypothetical protein